MRLVEVLDLGSLSVILRILKDLANKSQDHATIPFFALKQLEKNFDLPLGDGGPNSASILEKLKSQNADLGKIIKSIDPKTAAIILNTDAQNPNTPDTTRQQSSPTVDKMANAGAKKLQPDI